MALVVLRSVSEVSYPQGDDKTESISKGLRKATVKTRPIAFRKDFERLLHFYPA